MSSCVSGMSMEDKFLSLVRVSGPESVVSIIEKAEVSVGITGFTADIGTNWAVDNSIGIVLSVVSFFISAIAIRSLSLIFPIICPGPVTDTHARVSELSNTSYIYRRYRNKCGNKTI